MGAEGEVGVAERAPAAAEEGLLILQHILHAVLPTVIAHKAAFLQQLKGATVVDPESIACTAPIAAHVTAHFFSTVACCWIFLPTLNRVKILTPDWFRLCQAT